MSFNQISGKIHDRKPLLRKGQKQLSNRISIPYRRDANMISQHQSFRDPSFDDEPINKEDTKIRLPSIRRESLGKIEKINFEKVNRRSTKFFTQTEQQQKIPEEKKLSPVLESKISLNMPKKLYLNRWQQRAKQQQQSIIFNYLNEKVPLTKQKKKKKKKKLVKIAQKLQKMDRIYQFPKSDPRIHYRQMTEFKRQKVSKLNILQPHQKRRSLNFNQSKNVFALRRQTQTFKRQTKMIEELKIKVNELTRSEQALENKPSTKKYQFSNRTVESMSLALNDNNMNQIERKVSANSNRTNRTIEKTPKHGRELMQRKQSFRRVTQVPIEFLKDSEQKEIDLNLAQTIKFDEMHHRQENQYVNQSIASSSRKSSSSSSDQSLEQNLAQTKTHKESSQSFDEIQHNIENQNDQNQNQKQRKEPEFNHVVQKPKLKLPSRMPDKSFLQIKTYYALMSENPKLIQKTQSFIHSQSKTLELKNLPSKEELTMFLQNYVPQNPNIKLSSLLAMDNFQVILQENEELYFGQTVETKKSGLGVTIRHNYLYEGTYKDGQKLQGLQINEVGKYFGQFKNNKKNGHGEFLWKNGQKYDGQWVNGKKHGQGTWSSPNGDFYEGSWINGKVQGQGIHISNTSQKYEGSFHDYLKSGWGKQVLPNGDIYEGLFMNGKPHGQGTYTWSNGETYKGEFIEGFRHDGNGTLKDSFGNKYSGKFEKEQATGECEITFTNQDSFSGEVKDGKFHGRGTLILYEEQEIWKAQWQEDQFIGEIEESRS